MSGPRILVVDDSRAERLVVEQVLAPHGHAVEHADSAEAALVASREREFDLVLSDLVMPGRSGIELVGELHALRPETPVVLLTAHGSLDSAVQALRAGAFDYVTKPLDAGDLLHTVARALERRRLEAENRRLRRAVDRTASLGELLGQSAPMREIFALIRRVAASASSVLITGESGTGKELVARTLHFHGGASERPFVPINCTAMPEGLLESELFGHVRGAFTGATTSKRGLFEQAHRGTLFLDEIGDMGPGLQGKLLRVLQDGEIRPVGGLESQRVAVRVVAATHRDLERAIDEGRFRQDLFYRLNVIPIHIPPLRERPEDVPLLAEAFLRRHAGEGTPRRFSAEALEVLQRQPWRGNARELENLVERALAFSDAETISAEALPLGRIGAELGRVAAVHAAEADSGVGVGGAARAAPLGLEDAARRGVPLRELCDRYIDTVIAHCGGSKARAARALGVSRKTLYRRGAGRKQGSGK